MKHFIFCRYNLGMFQENVYEITDPLTWMAHRLPKYVRLLKSLKKQTNQQFQFIVALDVETPKEWKESVEQTTLEYLSRSSFKVIYDIPQVWINEQNIDADWVITSRIDNDDAYEGGFVMAIHDAFSQKTEVLDVKGIQIDELTDKLYNTGRRRANSPFLSLCEINKGKLRTCYDKMHTFMPDKYISRFVSDKPLYTQYLHERNVTNKINGKEI